MAFVDRFRQPRVFHAVAEEVGPHGEDHVRGYLLLTDRFEKELHERHSVVPGPGILAGAVSEELLELVDDDEDVVVIRQPRLANRRDEAQAAAAKSRVENHAMRGRQFAVAAAK